MMTFILIFLTAVVSVAAFGNRRLFDRLSMQPARVVHQREWYRAVSYGFVHGDTMHLVVNMLVLLSFGVAVERLFRAYEQAGMIFNSYWSYALLYFGGLVVSVLPDLIRRRNDPFYSSIGASGAVSAVVFCSIFFNPWSKIYFFGLIPIPGILFGALYVGYEYYMGRREGDHINHNAHLVGALYGFVFPLLMEPSMLPQFWMRLFHPGA
ncbi:MAG: rhomboid family intramembrane serine protease [Alistipes sp.]|nr:rhomboid family intramembrane serine protease [Alistipes sp.]